MGRDFNHLKTDSVEQLQSEIKRLKRGEFTPEEFKTLCHNLDDNEHGNRKEFCDGCDEYQKKLFGVSRTEILTSKTDQLRDQNIDLINHNIKIVEHS